MIWNLQQHKGKITTGWWNLVFPVHIIQFTNAYIFSAEENNDWLKTERFSKILKGAINQKRTSFQGTQKGGSAGANPFASKVLMLKMYMHTKHLQLKNI